MTGGFGPFAPDYTACLLIDQGYVYTEDGYQLNNLGSNPFATFVIGESRYKGSTALFNNTVGGTTLLTKIDAGTFTLNSIDLASLNNQGSFDINFVGIKSDSSTVSQKFTGNDDLLTYTFIGFTDLTQVEWIQDSPFHQFDNINLTSGGGNLSAVPVPAALPLMASALGIFGLARSRNKSKAA